MKPKNELEEQLARLLLDLSDNLGLLDRYPNVSGVWVRRSEICPVALYLSDKLGADEVRVSAVWVTALVGGVRGDVGPVPPQLEKYMDRLDNTSQLVVEGSKNHWPAPRATP